MKHHVPLDRRGLLSLAIFLELFNRELIGASLNPRGSADIVAAALAMTWFPANRPRCSCFTRDGAPQYASHALQDKLVEYGTTCSMSRGSDWRGKVPTESWSNTFEKERFHGVRYATPA